MKILLFLSLFALTAFGGAYIQLTPAHHYVSGQNEIKAAFNLHLDLIESVSYNGWLGGGSYPGTGTLWAATVHQVKVGLTEKLSLTPGLIVRTSASQVPNLEPFLSNSEVNVSLTYDLW